MYIYATCFPRGAGSNVLGLYGVLRSQFKTLKVRLDALQAMSLAPAAKLSAQDAF